MQSVKLLLKVVCAHFVLLHLKLLLTDLCGTSLQHFLQDLDLRLALMEQFLQLAYFFFFEFVKSALGELKFVL